MLAGALLKQTVHAVERFAAHVLPEDDHVGVELLAELPELVEQDLVSAVGTVAHDHVLGQPGHVVICLLAVFGRVLRDEFARRDHGENVRQRHDAPAVEQPDEEVHVKVRLHAPDDGAVAVLIGGLLLLAVGALGELGDLAIDFAERGDLAANGHVVRFGIQCEVGAKDLRVVGLVHLQPLEAALGGIVHALGALEVRFPVPLLAGVLFDEGNGVFDLLCSVILHVVLAVAKRRSELEYRDAVLKLETLGDDAVAEQGAVARRVALHGAGAEHRDVVVDGHARLRLGHRADVLIGAEQSYRGVHHCGYCGFGNCSNCKNAGGNCTFAYIDLGIAVSSAAMAAAMDTVDTRIMFSVGKAAAEMGYAENVLWLGIPISISGKSIFFDRGIFHD